MGYVVLGAGAIGAVVGGRLFQAGCDVTLIARGAHLEALQARGLRLESPASTDTVRLAAVGHPREIDWRTNHVVLMAVKSQQALAALCELAEVAPPETPIVCLQNGIANEPAALRMFPNVQGVSVACPACHLEPGVVQAWSTPVTGLLDIGVYPIGIDQVSEAAAADFRAATFSSHPVDDIRRWKYRKLLTNLGNAIEAVCGPHERQGPLGDILGLVPSPGARLLRSPKSCEVAGVVDFRMHLREGEEAERASKVADSVADILMCGHDHADLARIHAEVLRWLESALEWTPHADIAI